MREAKAIPEQKVCVGPREQPITIGTEGQRTPETGYFQKE